MTIDEGAVVAWRAIVTRDVAPYTIVMGNPAASLRERFDNAAVERLPAPKLYYWPDEKFTALRLQIGAADIAAFGRGHADWSALVTAG